MPRKQYTPEQIIDLQRQAEVELTQGAAVEVLPGRKDESKWRR
jgi:hypothetical protein